MQNAGVIAIHPEGEYNNSTEYTRLACVTFNGALYLSKRATVGHDPLDTYYWMFMMEEGSGGSSVNITYEDPGVGSELTSGDMLAVVYDESTEPNNIINTNYSDLNNNNEGIDVIELEERKSGPTRTEYYHDPNEQSMSMGKDYPDNDYDFVFTNRYGSLFSVGDYILNDNQYLWECTKHEIREDYSDFKFNYIGNPNNPHSRGYRQANAVFNSYVSHVSKLYVGVNNMAADYVPENHTTKNITLLASGWANKQYVISDGDITVGSDGVIGIDANATDEQRAAVRDAMIGVKAQAAGSLTLIADGDVPTINVPIILILFK